MRPYMLWLARVYAGTDSPIVLREHGGSGALEDWVSYQAELRMFCAWT